MAPTKGNAAPSGAGPIGYLPTRAGGFRDLTVAENLEFVAAVARVPSTGPRATDLLERTGLAPVPQAPGPGPLRRHAPEAGGRHGDAALPGPAVLDEPTTGIDPVSRSDLWRLIALAAPGGAAVLVSSAYLDEAERAPPGCSCSTKAAPSSPGPRHEVVASLPGAVVEVEAPADPGSPGGAAPDGGSGAREVTRRRWPPAWRTWSSWPPLPATAGAAP